MKKSQKNIQIILITLGIFLILATYFYPNIKNSQINKSQDILSDSPVIQDEDEKDKKDTGFVGVEYKGLYDLNKKFIVKSETAHINEDEPDVVYMQNMVVNLYLADGRIVNIISDLGKYNKVTYDTFFENNVKATDGDTIFLAENLDMLATESLVKVYNNVTVNYPTGTLTADKIDYDFDTKYFKVSMYDQNSVKVKVIK